MADVRALLAAERQSRRIVHPHLTYSKGGALICNVCNINVKAEQLWPGHLKSAGHRKNVSQKTRDVEIAPKSTKRKLEESPEEERSFEVDSRKKPRPEVSEQTVLKDVDSLVAELVEDVTSIGANYIEAADPPVPVTNDVDEAEWAAFERDMAETTVPVYAAATIEAAPVSAAELVAQQKADTAKQKEDEAEAEKADESRRMEEEFEVMEEMEDRVKRLRARHEALKSQQSLPDAENLVAHDSPRTQSKSSDQQEANEKTDHIEDSSDDEPDDWYG